MKKHPYLAHALVIMIIGGFLLSYQACSSARLSVEYKTDTLTTNPKGKGELLVLEFIRGPEHNHPLMAVWIETKQGTYIQTLYVAKSLAKGVFGHGDKSSGKWLPGPIRRPAALPVWSYSRGIQEEDGLYIPTEETAIPDAYTGATPPANFVLEAKVDQPLPKEFYVYFEINQTWDWNKYWTNTKYLDDEDYKTSCQPALVYRAFLSNKQKEPKSLELTGHSHPSGANGEIEPDLSTITTAKEITNLIQVQIIR